MCNYKVIESQKLDEEIETLKANNSSQQEEKKVLESKISRLENELKSRTATELSLRKQLVPEVIVETSKINLEPYKVNSSQKEEQKTLKLEADYIKPLALRI